jgi:predicted kinase
MPSIHLIEGPVGAGKSTFAAQLSLNHQAPLLNLDEWMVTLFSPDRPDDGFMQWYMDRKDRCIEQIWRVACELIETGIDVVLEMGLVQVADRESFYSRVDGAGYELHVYLVDAATQVRRQRVRERNREQGRTFKMEVTDEIFEIANGAWQPPDEAEIRSREIEVISTDT